MKRRTIDSLLVDLLTVVLYIKRKKSTCVVEYCVVLCPYHQLIISQ